MMSCVMLVLLLGVVAFVNGTNYCDRNLCGGGNHIACNHNHNWARSCPSDANMVNLGNDLKEVLVNAHNNKRNYIAGGNDPRHNAACKMATIQWDDELAYLASLNVLQCRMAHDSCHNTDVFRYSGQNLAYQGYSPSLPPVKTLLEKSVDMWYNEVVNSNRNYINSYPSNYKGPTIGHFTVMVAEKNIRLGCAASTYTSNGYKNFLLACNYATTNIIGTSIYSSCSRGGQNCSTGRNPKYPNLCSTSEKYNVNHL